jgi:hypothetical protein
MELKIKQKSAVPERGCVVVTAPPLFTETLEDNEERTSMDEVIAFQNVSL